MLLLRFCSYDFSQKRAKLVTVIRECEHYGLQRSLDSVSNTNSKLLYAITVLIWGSTWLVIKFQLGIVAPEVSIVYRFVLAAVLLMAFVASRRLPLRFDLKAHFFIALQGMLLFSVNYYLVYLASAYLPSGLTAIVFSIVVILNSLFGALFLGNPIRPRVVVGAVAGVSGLALVFWPELSTLNLSNTNTLGLMLSLLGAVSASLGNIVSARNQRSGLPVIQTNALGMTYGSLITLVIVAFNGTPINFDWSVGYVGSLLYLAVLGSVVAFGSYLTLLGRIGPDRAAYVMVLFPIVALGLSTVVEGFEWTLLAVAGVLFVLAGNVIVLTKVGAVRTRLAVETS
jgi:drug/metabolite transporter (DMT)-like permease